MIVYIVSNLSKTDEVLFAQYRDTTKVFTDPALAVRQYGAWVGGHHAFGSRELGVNLHPGTKNFHQAGDVKIELLTLEVTES